MQSPIMWTIVIALLVILVIFCIKVCMLQEIHHNYTFMKASIRPSNFPPGPPCLGWIGSLPYLDVRNLSRSFINLSQKYGDIFSIFVGTKPVVVLNSWTLISEGNHLSFLSAVKKRTISQQ